MEHVLNPDSRRIHESAKICQEEIFGKGRHRRNRGASPLGGSPDTRRSVAPVVFSGGEPQERRQLGFASAAPRDCLGPTQGYSGAPVSPTFSYRANVIENVVSFDVPEDSGAMSPRLALLSGCGSRRLRGTGSPHRDGPRGGAFADVSSGCLPPQADTCSSPRRSRGTSAPPPAIRGGIHVPLEEYIGDAAQPVDAPKRSDRWAPAKARKLRLGGGLARSPRGSHVSQASLQASSQQGFTFQSMEVAVSASHLKVPAPAVMTTPSAAPAYEHLPVTYAPPAPDGLPVIRNSVRSVDVSSTRNPVTRLTSPTRREDRRQSPVPDARDDGRLMSPTKQAALEAGSAAAWFWPSTSTLSSASAPQKLGYQGEGEQVQATHETGVHRGMMVRHRRSTETLTSRQKAGADPQLKQKASGDEVQRTALKYRTEVQAVQARIAIQKKEVEKSAMLKAALAKERSTWQKMVSRVDLRMCEEIR